MGLSASSRLGLQGLGVLVGIVTGLALPQVAESQTIPRLESLFPHQVEIQVDGEGWSRLVLPREVLAECRSDLSDLRIFDEDGREVPFLIDGLGPAREHLEAIERLTPRLLGVQQAEVHRTEGPPLRRETYRLSMPPEAPVGERWSLVLVTPSERLVLRVEVRALGAAGEEKPLVPDASVWRLDDPPREQMEVMLPDLPLGVEGLAVSLEGEQSSFASPAFRYERHRNLDPLGRLEVPLVETGRFREGGKTLVDLEVPSGFVPDVLRLETSTPSFHRVVEVWDAEGRWSDDAEPSSDRDFGARLGAGRLLRIDGSIPIEETELAVRPARGSRIRLVLEDGDSPPLDQLTVVAIADGPVLLFSLPKRLPGSRGRGVLRFGGGRAFRPRYDLDALLTTLGRGRQLTGRDAEVALGLVDPSQMVPAQLGTVEANPDFDGAPALAFAHRPGAEVDVRKFTYRRRIEAGSSAEGLYRVELPPAALAVARADLGDLRIVDPEGRQWAYLLDKSPMDARLSLAIRETETEGTTSRYRIELPASPVVVRRLALESSLPFFDRAYTLRAEVDGTERVLGAGRVRRRLGDPRPLAIRFDAVRLQTLELAIENGDDAPLTFSGVRGSFPTPQLYFAAPAGVYSLLLGDPEARTPRYELETVRDVVLALDGAPVEASSLAENPDYRTRSRWRGSTLQSALLWLVLAGAVLVLGTLTLRLSRSETRS